jgi:low affinity Fe/Cu permease
MIKEFFRKFAQNTSEAIGSPGSFILAVILLILWAISGPIFGFSDKWPLVINTATTIITFLMVFLIQNTQNRNAKATQLKLDELILSMHGARNTLVNLEELSDKDLEQIQKQFRRISEHYSKLPNTDEEIEAAKANKVTDEAKDKNQN